MRPAALQWRPVRALASCCLLALLAALAAPPVRAVARYVAPNGSDTAAGAVTSSWRTLRRSLPALLPGDVLFVRGGSYVEQLTSIAIHPGAADKPITVMAYPNERPVLVGLLWLTNPSYWIIDRINVTWNPTISNASLHMVKITNGVGWIFKRSELWGAHSYAAMLVAGTVAGQPANWTVSYNSFHDTYRSNSIGQDHLLYVNTGISAGAGLIERNVMYNAINGAGIKLGGYNSSQGTARVTVRYNTIVNTLQSILVPWRSQYNQIYRNLLVLTEATHACINAYELTGQYNVVSSNAGARSKQMILNDTGYIPLMDTGGNMFPLYPAFESGTPFGFYPTNTAAQSYGAHAP